MFGTVLVIESYQGGRMFIEPARYYRDQIEADVLTQHLNKLVDRFMLPVGISVRFFTEEKKGE